MHEFVQYLRQIFKSSAIYSIAVFAPSLTSFILLTSTRVISPLPIMDFSSDLLSMLLGGRFGETLCYLYANSKEDRDRHATVGTGLLGSLLIGAVIAGLGCLFSRQLSEIVFRTSDWADYFMLSLIALGLSLPLDTAFAWLRARDRAVSYVIAAVSRLAIGVVDNASLLVFFNQRISGVTVGRSLRHRGYGVGFVRAVPAQCAIFLQLGAFSGKCCASPCPWGSSASPCS